MSHDPEAIDPVVHQQFKLMPGWVRTFDVSKKEECVGRGRKVGGGGK